MTPPPLRLKIKFMRFSAPRGTKDIFPNEARFYHSLEEKARHVFKAFNYLECRTPMFENVKLFQRSLGQDTDVVQKQLLRLKSYGKDELVLRPEATASIVRAYIEHNIYKKEGLSKYYYIGSMFRGERPQKGRLREFTHIGAEVIGVSNPYLDVEIIALAVKLIREFGIQGYTLNINNLGCNKDKEKWSKFLRIALKDKINSFCELCNKRFTRNIFRILDCKNDNCRSILRKIKLEKNYLCLNCQEYFQIVLEELTNLKIAYKVSPFLVRGLDYYTRTVFEITHSSLGSQDALGAGGRYDNLLKQLGGPDLSAVGFALGLERILLTIKEKKEIFQPLDVYLVTLDSQSFKKGFLLLSKLRDEDIACDINYQNTSLKSQMRLASKISAKFVIIIGEEEIKGNFFILKNMASGKQEKINSSQIITELKKRL
jgi:histidyl-tRNA synthetase